MKYVTKIILVIACIGCLSKWPQVYALFAGIIFFTGFLYLAYLEYKARRIVAVIICIALALLLQPFLKLPLLQATWNLSYAIIAALLVIWLLIDVILNGRKNAKVTDKTLPF
jgi:hypothetical protein